MSKDKIQKNSDGPSMLTAHMSGGPEPREVLDMREVGATGLRRFSGFIYEEFLPELTGWKGVAVYKEMASNDATVGAVLFAIKMLCRRVKWFTKPASSAGPDLEAAEFLETCMNDMSQTWIDTINEILSMLEFGYSVEEIVYKRRCGDSLDPSLRSDYADGRVGWRKLSIRSADTIYRWQFDDHGGIQGVEQLAPPHYYHVTIPVEKFLLFRTTTEKNNPEGKSVLRTAYRSWYMKKNIENIEAIGVERDLAGLPVAWVPPEILSPNANDKEKALLAAVRELTINVRRNAQEGMIMPLDYDDNGKPRYEFKLLSTGGSRQFDTTAIINRYDQRIAMSALADFILLGQDKVGSFALASSKTNLFSTAIGAFMDIIADVFNRYAVPRLFKLNDFRQISAYPQIQHGDLGSVDLRELGDYIQKLSMSGMPLFPSVELEKHLLEIAGLPPPPEPDTGAKPDVEQAMGAREQAPLEIPEDPRQRPTTAPEHPDQTPVADQPPVARATTEEDPQFTARSVYQKTTVRTGGRREYFKKLGRKP